MDNKAELFEDGKFVRHIDASQTSMVCVTSSKYSPEGFPEHLGPLENKKQTHDKVGYVYPSPRIPFEKCGKCSMLIRSTPLACTEVEKPIQWNGWCELFEQKKED